MIGFCGCSSGVEHNLAKVGVVGSNPIARSKHHIEIPGGNSRVVAGDYLSNDSSSNRATLLVWCVKSGRNTAIR